MSASALMFALALMASDAPPPGNPQQGEPLPAGAPTEDYPLTAWCYGAMSEYLTVYDRVKPDLKAIDKMFGSSEPKEREPYASDMAAAHVELKVLADAVVAAEKASPSPIAQQGAESVKLGRSIWAPAESKTSRELARAWLSWALPDRCDSTARSLASKSALLGQALRYNTSPDAAPPQSPPATPDSQPSPPTETPPANTSSPAVEPQSQLPGSVTPSPSSTPEQQAPLTTPGDTAPQVPPNPNTRRS
jgi:hypothetical protein